MQLHQCKKNGHWMFHYQDCNGKRSTKSCGNRTKEEAEEFMNAFLSHIKRVKTPTLQEAMQLYQNKDTNPKYRMCKTFGMQYSERHAEDVARNMKAIEKVLMKDCKNIMLLELDEITRSEANRIVEVLVMRFGRCRCTQIKQQQIKVIFAQALQDGIINYNPFEKQLIVRYNIQKRESIEPELIFWLIDHPEYFRDKQEWAYFTVCATTGMRRSEVLALHKSQIDGNILTIDRACKSTKIDGPIGLPKYDITRTIPLSKLTMKALSVCNIHFTGRLFYKPYSWVDDMFQMLKARLSGIDPEHKDKWEKLGSHVLRHSFNTNMLVAGGNQLFVAEYCGWEHQGLVLEVQKGYTHFRVNHLQSVANLVDSTYEEYSGVGAQKAQNS